MTRNDLFRIVRLKLIEMSFIEQAIEKLAYFIRLAMIFRKNFVDFVSWSARWSARILAGGSQASSLRILRQL